MFSCGLAALAVLAARSPARSALSSVVFSRVNGDGTFTSDHFVLLNMPLSYEQVQQEVQRAVEHRVIARMLAHLETEGDAYLMGRERPRDFATKVLYIALYHDLAGHGHDRIRDDVKDWLPLSKTSFEENQTKIRLSLSVWAQEAIVIGDMHSWRSHAVNVPLPAGIPSAELILDSADFRRTGKRKMSRKSEWWSTKENGPAIRVQCLTDLVGYVRYVSSYYSPKVFDSDFLRFKKKEWDVRVQGTDGVLAGSTVLADSHYAEGGRDYERVTWITPKVEQPAQKTKRGAAQEELEELPAAKEAEELLIKQKWAALRLFREPKEQQWYLILIACVVHNELIRLSRGVCC